MSPSIKQANHKGVSYPRRLTAILPVIAITAPGALLAQAVTNTAAVTAPAGALDSNQDNNTVVSVTDVHAVMAAVDDSVNDISGASGGIAVINVFAGDTVGALAASPDNAVLSVASGSTVPTGLTFDPMTGAVDVAPGTPEDTYSFDYQICEKANPDNCKTASVTIGVVAATLDADADTVRAPAGTLDALNVLDGDTLNGDQANLEDVDIAVLVPAEPDSAGDMVPLLDPATGMVDIPAGTPAGIYEITYQICETINPANCAQNTVTITVEPPAASVEGTVYLDRNADGNLDPDDEQRGNWTVEILKDGNILATTVADGNGFYRFDDVPAETGYDIQFRNPENNVVYGRIDNIDLTSGSAVVEQNLPIDPSGVLFDSITREPLSNVTATLLGPNGLPLPSECFLDPSQRTQITGETGEYRFDIIPGASPQCPPSETEYTISITPPDGFTFSSSVFPPQSGPFDPTGLDAPVRIAPTPDAYLSGDPAYYLNFLLESGDPDVIFNHIPVDPFLVRTPLVITKTSTKRDVSVGDLVPYTITVRNNEDVQRAGVSIIDLLPSGFKYVLGSSLVDGVAVEPLSTQSNRQVEWQNQTIPANVSVTYNLALTVGVGVTTGTKINTAYGTDTLSGTPISNRGTAAVRIVPSNVFDCSELLGKVFEDQNRNGYQDDNEPGVPAVRLGTVNGLLITTDEHGRYHIPCAAVPDARIGSNFILKLDPRTLPIGWEVTTDNPRSIRMTRGKMGELNFGVAPIKLEETPEHDVQKKGEEK